MGPALSGLSFEPRDLSRWSRPLIALDNDVTTSWEELLASMAGVDEAARHDGLAAVVQGEFVLRRNPLEDAIAESTHNLHSALKRGEHEAAACGQVVAHWGPRQEPREVCAEHLSEVLIGLRELDPLLGKWFKLGKSRQDALRVEYELDLYGGRSRASDTVFYWPSSPLFGIALVIVAFGLSHFWVSRKPRVMPVAQHSQVG